jgi:hypothetical protein
LPTVSLLKDSEKEKEKESLLTMATSSCLLPCCYPSSSPSPTTSIPKLEKAVTSPSSWYTHPSFFDLEPHRVFYRGFSSTCSPTL